MKVQAEYGSFHVFLKGLFEKTPIMNEWKTDADVPVQTVESERLSKVLQKRGFSFVGPVICYAFMQATGIVNDHILQCSLYHKNEVTD